MKRLLLSSLLMCLLTPLALSQNDLPSEVYTTPGPHVVVNGVILQAPVQRVSGSLLLPMRAVFEALQAEVRWFPAAQQITAIRGDVTVQLWINKPVAIVNDKEIPLTVPPQLLEGTTFVPLRFPAEVFGGDVRWLTALQTASISITPLKPATTPPPVDVTPTPTPVLPTEVSGMLVGKNTEVGQALLYQNAAGDLSLIQLVPTVKITRGQPKVDATVSTFAELQPGDAVKITRNADGKATVVAATYQRVTGKLAAIANNKVLLTDGSLYQLRADAGVTDTNGKAVALSALSNGKDITLQVTPETTLIWAIIVPAETAVLTPTAKKPDILALGPVAYTAPLKAGDTLTIQATGTPGANKVSARLGDVIKDITLEEKDPGIYRQTVTIKPGTNATAVPLFAIMTIGNDNSAEVRSTQSVTIDTIPPVIKTLVPGKDAEIIERSPGIEVAFADTDGSGVDPASIVMLVNAEDVTKAAIITPEGIGYKAKDLPLGTVRLQVKIADKAGNPAQIEWNITVKAPPPAAQAISLTHSATGPVMAGKSVTLYAKLTADPVKLEWYLGNKLISRNMIHDAGQLTYRTTYLITPQDALGDQTVSVRVFSNTTQSQVIFAETPVKIIAVVKEFAVTIPVDKAKVGNTVTISGEGPVNAQIRVTMAYTGQALILSVKGQLYQGTVTTGPDGTWTTPPIDTGIPLGKATAYSVKVELLDKDSKTIKTQDLTLTPQ